MRLIDADRLKRQVEGRSWRAKGKMVELIDNSPTIRVGENTCKYRTPDGVCKLYTNDKFTSYCVDGPCTDEEPIEAPDVKHGRWIDMDDHVMCSCCGATHYGADKNYCPNCGSRMDEEATE